jgi:hypothetical protein
MVKKTLVYGEGTGCTHGPLLVIYLFFFPNPTAELAVRKHLFFSLHPVRAFSVQVNETGSRSFGGAELFFVKPIDTNIALLWSAALYTQPSLSTMTDAVLLGDKWIVSNPHILTDMEVINQDMDLQTDTLYMEDYDTANRLQRPSDAKLIPPQKVFALEKTQYGIYHVRSQDGDTFWINPDYAQPFGAEKINESLDLKVETILHLFPTMPFPTFGVLTPQKVTAFEKWTDPQGKRWYHIHTWTGDMWVQSDEQG